MSIRGGPDRRDARREDHPALASHHASRGRPAGPERRPAPGETAPDTGRAWLRNAMAALAVLAAAAAVVSWDAQYVMVRQVKHIPAISALEAGIPDAGALIFAALGIALALHGRRALRPRTLNVACVGLSLAMNAMAAGRGWRDIAIWVMPAAVYALASDTLIGVVRAWALARMQATGQDLAGDDVTPLAVAGAVLLWLLRLSLAPASTLTGFRRWVIEECPVAPGRTAPATPPPAPAPRPPHQRSTSTRTAPATASGRQTRQARPADRPRQPAPRPAPTTAQPHGPDRR